MRNFKIPLFSILVFFIFSNTLCADEAMQALQESVNKLTSTVESLKSTVFTQNEIISRQTVRIEALEHNRGASSGQTAAVSPTGAPTTIGPVGYNPEIGVTGTVQTKLTENTSDEEDNDTIALKELELNFAQVVDHFSRLDAIISFNDNLEEQNVDIEEAYYTRWGLPLGFTGQIGKFRSKIGKENLMHLHQLPTTNYPLVIRDFFGDEGLASSGARIQNMVPNPWDIPVEITGEILRGNNGTSFSGISRRPIFNTHLKTYFEPTEDTGLELGWTTLFGDENPPRSILVDDGAGTGTFMETFVTQPEGQDRYGVKAFGGDATFIWNLPEERKVTWQNEIYFQDRTSLVHMNESPWGFYSLLDARISPQFSAGIRFDYIQPLDIKGDHDQSTEISPYLVFWQSEFADFKLQYSHTEPANENEKSDNAIYLQADFLIGAHKHPVQ